METVDEVIVACPGCGCEPEIESRLVDKATGKRVGYRCGCGTVVLRGQAIGVTHG